MDRRDRDFTARPQPEQEWLLQETWCDSCQAADLGMVEPHEYEEDGSVYVEGLCRNCRSVVRAEVMEWEAG